MSNHLSLLVHCYFLAALAYNVASQALHDMTGRKLAPTDPVFGILFISLVYLVLAARHPDKRIRLYRLADRLVLPRRMTPPNMIAQQCANISCALLRNIA